MRGLAMVIVAVGVAISLPLACHGSDVVNPPTGPNTSYPCGVWGVECRAGGCCPWAHICGDSKGYGRFNRCPDGYCCKDADPLYGAGDAGDAGPVGEIFPQRRPR